MGLFDWFVWQDYEAGCTWDYTREDIDNLPTNKETKTLIEYDVKMLRAGGQLPTVQDQGSSNTGGNWQATGSDACY